MENTLLVLDAMGVIYAAADDVLGLLVPFVIENGGISDAAAIADHYVRASLGEIDAAAFWHAVGVSPDAEDEYLSRHRLTDGLLAFLDNLPPRVSSVWCLSNDVAQWAGKLRSLHKLDDRLAGFVISGEVGVRKPHRGIYDRLLVSVRRPANTCLFVDDRPKNLDAARSLGFGTIHFDPTRQFAGGQGHTGICSFEELADCLRLWERCRIQNETEGE